MASLAKKITRSAGFANKKELYRVTYDFAVDAGAQAAYDIFEADGAVVITDFYVVVKTTCTSGGSATVKAGKTGDDDSFLKTTEGAVANLVANAVFPAKPELTEGTPNTIAPRLPTRLADGEKLLMTIGTADLTAGKLEFVFEVAQA